MVTNAANSANIKGVTFNLSYTDPNTHKKVSYSVYVAYTEPSQSECEIVLCGAVTTPATPDPAAADASQEAVSADPAADAEAGVTTDSAAPADTTATETPVEDPTAEATPVDTATDAG